MVNALCDLMQRGPGGLPAAHGTTTRDRDRRTLYPWLMPLMNCWGGGFHRKRMAVEFTASVCTFCGGAVGTVVAASQTMKQQWEARAGRGRGRGRERQTLSCVWVHSRSVLRTPKREECFWKPTVAFRGKRIGYFSFSVAEFFKA